MVFDVYAGPSWISRRLGLHFAVIGPTMIVCSYYVGELYGAIASTFLCFVYGALTWGQIQNPLISASSSKLKITNLFHLGVMEIEISSIRKLSISGRKLEVITGEENLAIPLSGLSKESQDLLWKLCESL